MNTNYQSIRLQINELGDDDKIRLLSKLCDALCHSEQAARQQKWAAVAESRLAAYDSGNMVAEDWRTLHQRLQR